MFVSARRLAIESQRWFVEWTDVNQRVLIPRWQRTARDRSHILNQIRIESPPVTERDVIQLGRTHGGLKMRIKDDANVAHYVLFGIGCGVMSRLILAGWTPVPSPALYCEFVRGDDRIDPMSRVYAIAAGHAPLDDWAAFCEKQGLTGPLA